MKVLILMGLPGSGKTTYANEVKKNDTSHVHIINLDQLLKEHKKTSIRGLSKLDYYGGYVTNVYVIDGLIHTNEQLLDTVNKVVKNEGLINIEVHYWKENRRQCLINDMYRRDMSCITSIKHLPLDIPDLEQLRNIFPNIVICKHDVPIKPNWLLFNDKYCLGCTLDNPYFKSDSWSTGGSYGNCWNDNIVSFDGDIPLTEFKQFDDLIENIDKHISFKTYKEIYNHCVSIGTTHESDYYGGVGSNYAFFQCNVELLYEKLSKLGLLLKDM